MAYNPVAWQGVQTPEPTAPKISEFFAPHSLQELKREEVRFAAAYNPHSVFAEATRQLSNPNPSTALYR